MKRFSSVILGIIVLIALIFARVKLLSLFSSSENKGRGIPAEIITGEILPPTISETGEGENDAEKSPSAPEAAAKDEKAADSARSARGKLDSLKAAEIIDRADPIASPDAVSGGSIVLGAAAMPKSFNPYLDNNTFSYQIFGLMFESLLSTDPITGEYSPGIARRWTISEDRREFTFFIDPLAKWSDGTPISAEDVLWTFERIVDPASQTGPHKVSLMTFTNTPPTVIDSQTIRFTASEVHWRNLGAVGGIEILPKHIFKDKDFNKINNEFPVVSGPYKIASHKEGVSLEMERRSDWWGRARSATRGTINFNSVIWKFYSEADNAFDAFLAGEIDVYPVYRASIWAERTSGPKFDNHWIVKQEIFNSHPTGFQGFAMNMRRAPFDDLRVRKAFAMLLDRRRLVDTLMHGAYFLHSSYFEDLYDAENPCENELIAFDPAAAAELLESAGWKKPEGATWREKDGKRLTFTFLTRDETTDKFLALYRDDLKKVGVEMKIERKDWAAWSRDMDEYNYDMTWAAWSTGLLKDPESMWSSAEADTKGGNNITGFKNKVVDELIAEQRGIFELALRNDICRKIDSIISAEVPYILLWNTRSTRLLYWDKFGTPPTVLSKFGDDASILYYWWHDDDSAAELSAAQDSGDILPARPEVISFDKVFEEK